jgi:hypothetical protein
VVEERIAFLENELALLARQLEEPPPDLAEVHKLGTDFANFEKELDQLMAEWEQIHMDQSETTEERHA